MKLSRSIVRAITLNSLLCSTFLLPLQVRAEDSGKEIAAVVQGSSITIAEIDKEIQRKPVLAFQLKSLKDNPSALNKLRRMAVEGIINRRLLLAAAQSSKTINEKEVQASVDKVVTQYSQGGEKLEDLLKGMGTTVEQFKADVANDYRISTFVEKEILGKVSVSPEEVKKVFETTPQKYAEQDSVHARHILIRTLEAGQGSEPGGHADTEAKKSIDALYAQVIAPGADFAKIASQDSECPSRQQGGDLGSFTKGMMVPEFEQVAFSMKPGEISKPFKTQFGYHIVKVEEVKQGKAADLVSASPKIEKEILETKKGELIQKKLSELRTAAGVEIKLPTDTAHAKS